MNRLKARSRIVSSPPGEPEPDVILTELFADGKLLVDFEGSLLSTDLLALDRSIHHDGEFFIVTCTCGAAGCAGIREGIRVTRSDGNVHWVVRGLGPTQTFYFDPEAYQAAIEQGIRQLGQLVDRCGLLVYPDYNLNLLEKGAGPGT